MLGVALFIASGGAYRNLSASYEFTYDRLHAGPGPRLDRDDDQMIQAVDLQFGQVEKQDATVVADPATANATDAALRAIPGVTVVERAITTPVTASHDGRSCETTLSGYAQNTVMHGFCTPEGGWTELPSNGIVAGQSLVDKLGVAVGDQPGWSTNHWARCTTRTRRSFRSSLA